MFWGQLGAANRGKLRWAVEEVIKELVKEGKPMPQI